MPIPELQRRGSPVCVLGSLWTFGRERSPFGRTGLRSIYPERRGAKAVLSALGEGMSLQGQEWRGGKQLTEGFGEPVTGGRVVD